MKKISYMELADFKAGFVAILGKPNVGKSTLMNRLIGEKLSIVTPKPQTTRMNIKGFLNTEKVQIVFLDTPGIIEPKYELHEKMMGYVNQSLKGADVVVHVFDGFETSPYPLLEGGGKTKPTICVLNKSDLCDKMELEEKKGLLAVKFDKVFCVSALHDKNLDDLVNGLISLLPYSPPLYNQDDLSDMPMRFFAQEIIREKIFLTYNDEIPYCSTVVVEKWSEEENRDVIQANIWIERDSQKPIVIGKNGDKIGKVRKHAEHDIALLTGRKAVLNLWVKVKYDWRKKYGALHEFGYR